jgi:hypothetical protein
MSHDLFADTTVQAGDEIRQERRFDPHLSELNFGFFPGVGPYEAIRHKLSPGFDFSFAPEVTSTELQQQVFGRQEIRPRKELSFSLNQTFEAKRRQAPVDTTRTGSLPADTLAADTLSASGGPLPRAPRQEIVTLLALRTTAIQYDFVEADEQGDPLFGFQTTRISNQISSDFLRGLSISMSHDLFADTTVQAGDEIRQERRFDPHLSELNFGFSSAANTRAAARWKRRRRRKKKRRIHLADPARPPRRRRSSPERIGAVPVALGPLAPPAPSAPGAPTSPTRWRVRVTSDVRPARCSAGRSSSSRPSAGSSPGVPPTTWSGVASTTI